MPSSHVQAVFEDAKVIHGRAKGSPTRLSVLSIQTEVDIDNEVSDDGSDYGILSRAEHFGPARTPAMKPAHTEAGGDFRLAWLRVEGWRAQLRKGGDIVEKARWEWRVDDVSKHPNMVPVIVAKIPGVLRGSGVSTGGRKSVHWE
jgi:hypothetical protein